MYKVKMYNILADIDSFVIHFKNDNMACFERLEIRFPISSYDKIVNMGKEHNIIEESNRNNIIEIYKDNNDIEPVIVLENFNRDIYISNDNDSTLFFKIYSTFGGGIYVNSSY